LKNNTKKVINNNPRDLTNFIFGDIYHAKTLKKAKEFENNISTCFVNKKIDKNLDEVVLKANR
jgi:hypothetical protein